MDKIDTKKDQKKQRDNNEQKTGRIKNIQEILKNSTSDVDEGINQTRIRNLKHYKWHVVYQIPIEQL